MDKWSILAYFLLAVGFFELSGRQLLALEYSGKQRTDLTTPTYYFWFSMNLGSLIVGVELLVKLVSQVLRLEQPLKKERRKMKLRKLWKNIKGGAGPATVASIAVGVLIMAYILPIGLLAIADANTTGWTAVVITIFQTVLPILVVLGLALKYVPKR